jgi:hypothetical protein
MAGITSLFLRLNSIRHFFEKVSIIAWRATS